MKIGPGITEPLVFLAAAALAGCTVITPAAPEQVNAGYAASGGSFNSGGALILLLRVREEDGRTVVCGARTETRMSAVSIWFVPEVLDSGTVQVAGSTLLQGVYRFPEHPLAEDMQGAAALCFATDVPWDPDFASSRPEVRFVRRQFDEEEDGVIDVFREGAVPALGTRG